MTNFIGSRQSGHRGAVGVSGDIAPQDRPRRRAGNSGDVLRWIQPAVVALQCGRRLAKLRREFKQRLANGETLATRLECDRYETARYGAVPLVDAVATRDADGRVTVFAVNRSTTGDVGLDIDLDGFGSPVHPTATTLADRDPYAANTLADPDRVAPYANETVHVDDGMVSIVLPPVSWTVIVLEPQA